MKNIFVCILLLSLIGCSKGTGSVSSQTTAPERTIVPTFESSHFFGSVEELLQKQKETGDEVTYLRWCEIVKDSNLPLFVYEWYSIDGKLTKAIAIERNGEYVYTKYKNMVANVVRNNINELMILCMLMSILVEDNPELDPTLVREVSSNAGYIGLFQTYITTTFNNMTGGQGANLLNVEFNIENAVVSYCFWINKNDNNRYANALYKFRTGYRNDYYQRIINRANALFEVNRPK